MQNVMRKKLNLPPLQIEKIDFPEEFVTYAKQKLAADEEYVRHTACFGPPILKEWAMMILAATGENSENPAKAPEQKQKTVGRE